MAQQKGHVSAKCTNPPTAKRKKATDAADVIIDMSPWAEDFAQWRRAQPELASASAKTASGLAPDVDADAYVDAAAETEPGRTERAHRSAPQTNDEEINGLEETKGCAILDSGATITCSSMIAAEGLQMQRLNRKETGLPTVSDSDRRFRFADGRVDEAQTVVEQPITAGLLSGRTIKMHLIDRAGNDTCPLLSMHDLRTLRMVVDYEDGTNMFKDNPNVWHNYRLQKIVLMMIPLTKEACERHAIITPPPPRPPQTTAKKEKETKRRNKLSLLNCNAVATAKGRMVWHHLPCRVASCFGKAARGSMKKKRGVLLLSQPSRYPLLQADSWQKKATDGPKN